MPALDFFRSNDLSDLWDAISELRQELNREDIDKEIEKKTKNLIEQVLILQGRGEDKKSLKNIVLATKDLLTGHESLQTYQARAAHVQGAPSLGKKILGGLMMALGAALLITLLCVAPATFPMAAGYALMGLAMMPLLAGVLLLANGCQSGLSERITDLSEAKTHSI